MFRQESLTRFLILTFPAILLAACQPAAPTVDLNAMMTQAVQTALATLQPPSATATRVSTKSHPTATATLASLTPPALPPIFKASSLNPLDTPHTYISDTCQYLKDLWTSTNSAPGTMVLVIMFHSISQGPATDSSQISSEDQIELMNNLHDMGFQAIDTQQMAAFIYNNAKISPRSVLLIQDDRRTPTNFIDHFLPFYKKWGWPVVNGWISLDDAIGREFLPGNVALSQQGWVDYQAHGVVHNIPISDSSSDEYIHSEIYGSMQAISQNFGKAPIAYIWPGGGFTPKAVQVAREAGFRLGFTTNPRGPVMFNWVPLADQFDPQRPYLIAEGPANDPPMLLPRMWDTDASTHLDEIRQIGNDATAYAQQYKATELDYYNIVCAAKDGPIP